jgi:hypothetical protein
VARARGPLESISESVDEGGAPREFFSKPFEFLSLGLLAYVGAPPKRARQGLSGVHWDTSEKCDLFYSRCVIWHEICRCPVTRSCL